MVFQNLSEFAGRASCHDDIDVIVAQLSVSDDKLTKLRPLLCDEERERADRFVFARDRDRFIVARARLRQLLADRLDMAPQQIEFSYGVSGKPSLATQPPGKDLRFNVSHSDDLAVYAFAEGREVGVDVEAVSALEDRDDVAQHCFSSVEQRAYFELSEADRTQGFFNCWTRKEALVKALGDGLNFPLDAFDVTLAPGKPAEILNLGSLPGNRCDWEMNAFSPMPGFVGAVVIQKSKC